MLHELGHIVGIDHPESGGFSLRPFDTVMHQLAPAKPKAGSVLHAFGPCDVATLQERYDVPSPTTPISACNDVDTTLGLTASEHVRAPRHEGDARRGAAHPRSGRLRRVWEGTR